MSSCFHYQTTYFWQEGKDNLRDCLRIAFEAAKQHGIEKIVIFTGEGEGVKIAYDEFSTQSEYNDIQIVAVTFPHGYKREISPEDRDWMMIRKIPVVQAHLPFDPIKAQFQGHGILGQDFSLLGNALNIFGGSISLCVQAVLMACDAGTVSKGEHVIALTSDTSILVRSAPTSQLLTDFIVREIFCKSAVLDISKREQLEEPAKQQQTPELPEDGPSKLLEGDK
jgi:hypothetical protein